MRRLALLVAFVGAVITSPMGAKASAVINTNNQLFPASNCLVHVTVGSSGVAGDETITVKVTCGPNFWGYYPNFLSVSANDSLSGCWAGGSSSSYPIATAGPFSCRVATAVPGPHNINVSLSFDPHDLTYSPGCAQDTVYDPSYEECGWSFVAIVA